METIETSGLAKDPVCGMSVDPETAKHTSEHAGQTYYFCCAGCAEKFKSDPTKYLKPAAAGLVTIGAIASCHGSNTLDLGKDDEELHSVNPAGSAYVCPMCPEVRQFKPGP
ncbi:MAG TPA: YHS domain-containing protein, partial [Terriglobales bacterium]|nr:YHS domain-containing protein [Terriglobales bacterium]